MNKPADLSIPDADWQRTPASVQGAVVSLWGEVKQLRAEVGTLREQVEKTSRNSSRPPSSDPPSVEKPARRPSGRPRGGQPGHEGHGRSLLPVAQVDEVVAVKPSVCRSCGAELSGDDGHPLRHQVTEIPPVRAYVTEYQLHTLACPHCQMLTEATLPDGVPSGAFGPRVQALTGLLSAGYRLSKRKVQSLLSDGFGVEMSLGSVTQQEQIVSDSLAAPVAAAQAYIQEQEVVNMDETGWSEGKTKAWLWTAVTTRVTVFVIRLSRGSKVVRELLGETFDGVIGSDRWSAYSFLPLDRRQLCWSHLKREFQAFVDRGGESAAVGERLLAQVDQMFTWWHRVRDGTLKRSSFQTYMVDLKVRVHLYLESGQQCAHPETAATCRELLKVERALWTFVYKEGVEPTNNAAEQAVRHGVLWRNSSFGTQSAAGSRFAERMMTAIATLRQQQRNVLDYLTQACQAALLGQPPPSLLPQQLDPALK